MGTTNEEYSEDLFIDQEWLICEKCGTLQLGNLLPLDVLYAENHNAVIGSLWLNHHKSFRNFVLQDEISSICEIGAAHGHLAKLILEEIKAEYLIIEPNPLFEDPRIKIIDGWVEDNTEEISKFTTIIHSHVLEHIYHPFDFMNRLAKSLQPKASMYISFPNIEELIKAQGINSLNFEHTFFLHPENFEWILRRIGLKVDRVEKFENHSLFYKCSLDNQDQNALTPNPPDITEYSLEFIYMWENLREFVAKTNKQLKNTTSEIFVFGAHVFAQGLINIGLETSNIKGIIDNDPAKQGKRLYGTRLKIFSPDVLASYDKPTVVLKASHYQNEVKRQILGINPEVTILE